MCGIAGYWGTGARSPDALLALAARMAGSLVHRGPDDDGAWADEGVGLVLGHRRLAVLDRTAAGHQPMVSANGRLVLVFNGEIYNHVELRRQLEAERKVAWRGHSDTETLLECVAAWGLEATLARAVGMFALALWDRDVRRLQLARDRFGEKPLYYGWSGGSFVFASELRAIRLVPSFDNPVNREALVGLFARGYVDGPASIYSGLFKLEPGCVLTLNAAAARSPRDAAPREGDMSGGLALRAYWRHADVVLAGLTDPIGDKGQALERLEAALAEAIRGQSVADVPVGVFLSGGIDSSLVTALYRLHGGGKVRTFTIGFEEAAYDEAPFAREFARHLDTEHVERRVSAKDAQATIPSIPSIYDEPFGDSSQIPTFLVSKLAREHVTVALSGDGGDELFGGYNRYFGTIRLWSALQWVPAPTRMAIGKVMASMPASAWNVLAACLRRRPPAHFGDRVSKVFTSLGEARDIEGFLRHFLSDWARNGSPVLGVENSACGVLDPRLAGNVPDVVAMMHADATRYMPGDILCKVDRAAMAVSLETRALFLDHRVAELAARIPVSMKIGSGEGKKILKQLLYRHAPADMFSRPKSGFAIPIDSWLRGPLRDWAEAMLDVRRLQQQGFLDAQKIHQRWANHLAGREQAGQAIWPVLMFQAWLERHHSSL